MRLYKLVISYPTIRTGFTLSSTSFLPFWNFLSSVRFSVMPTTTRLGPALTRTLLICYLCSVPLSDRAALGLFVLLSKRFYVTQSRSSVPPFTTKVQHGCGSVLLLQRAGFIPNFSKLKKSTWQNGGCLRGSAKLAIFDAFASKISLRGSRPTPGRISCQLQNEAYKIRLNIQFLLTKPFKWTVFYSKPCGAFFTSGSWLFKNLIKERRLLHRGNQKKLSRWSGPALNLKKNQRVVDRKRDREGLRQKSPGLEDLDLFPLVFQARRFHGWGRRGSEDGG